MLLIFQLYKNSLDVNLGFLLVVRVPLNLFFFQGETDMHLSAEEVKN